MQQSLKAKKEINSYKAKKKKKNSGLKYEMILIVAFPFLLLTGLV